MNIFNADFTEFINCLNDNNVEYILVGGYAVIIRGYSRSTGDLDIWVNKLWGEVLWLNQVVSWGTALKT